MKRFISVFAVVMALVATAASFSSCSKDKDEPKKSSLAGTTWVYTAEEGTEAIANIKISFPDDTNFKLTMSILGEEAQAISGTYVYEVPTVTLTALSLGTGTVSGTISGDKLTMALDGQTVVFTKQ